MAHSNRARIPALFLLPVAVQSRDAHVIRRRSAAMAASLSIETSATSTTENSRFLAEDDDTLYSYPDFRFSPWNNVPVDTMAHAEILGYEEFSWNVIYTEDNLQRNNEIEALSMWSIDNFFPGSFLKAVIDMGFSEEVWDCWINHYEDYDWEEFVSYGFVEPWIVLGWDEAAWNSEKPEDWPTTWNAKWEELSPEQQAAADELCYTQEIYDNVPIPEWGPGTQSSHPSAPPTSNPSMTPSTVSSHDPTAPPTSKPSMTPSAVPSRYPTESTSPTVSAAPSVVPTISTGPSVSPSVSAFPSSFPSTRPSSTPTTSLSPSDSRSPTPNPSSSPSSLPSPVPSTLPSQNPTESTWPTVSAAPSVVPTLSSRPSVSPSTSTFPSPFPSTRPSSPPTTSLSPSDSRSPTLNPSSLPSSRPSISPTLSPSFSKSPARNPSSIPSSVPSYTPTELD